MINRNQIEIFDQKHEMYAEGKHTSKPDELEIRELLLFEGYDSYNYDISYDSMMNVYNSFCKIKKAIKNRNERIKENK
jgi:hypothetical protein